MVIPKQASERINNRLPAGIIDKFMWNLQRWAWILHLPSADKAHCNEKKVKSQKGTKQPQLLDTNLQTFSFKF